MTSACVSPRGDSACAPGSPRDVEAEFRRGRPELHRLLLKAAITASQAHKVKVGGQPIKVTDTLQAAQAERGRVDARGYLQAIQANRARAKAGSDDAGKVRVHDLHPPVQRMTADGTEVGGFQHAEEQHTHLDLSFAGPQFRRRAGSGASDREMARRRGERDADEHPASRSRTGSFNFGSGGRDNVGSVESLNSTYNSIMRDGFAGVGSQSDTSGNRSRRDSGGSVDSVGSRRSRSSARDDFYSSRRDNRESMESQGSRRSRSSTRDSFHSSRRENEGSITLTMIFAIKDNFKVTREKYIENCPLIR